jgi:hypothetical protein
LGSGKVPRERLPQRGRGPESGGPGKGECPPPSSAVPAHSVRPAGGQGPAATREAGKAAEGQQGVAAPGLCPRPLQDRWQ